MNCVRWTASGTASYGTYLGFRLIQPVKALAGVDEVMALDEKVLVLEPVQCVPDSPRRQGGFTDDILLGQLSARFQHFVYELGRWWQVPDQCYSGVISVSVYDKNDPS